MKRLNIKSQKKTLQSEFIEFSLKNENEFIVREQADISSIEAKGPVIVTSQKIVYQFEEEKSSDDNSIDQNDEMTQLLHNIEKREFPNVDIPYRVLGVAYTMNCQNFTSVYKKYTYCNIKDHCYSNK